MHLIPNFTLAAILVVAWRREWIGAILFTGLGVFFLLNWIFWKELRPPTEAA